MYCQNCGHEISDVADVCLSCGAMVNKPKPEEQTSKTALGVLFAFILGIFGIVVGFVLYPNKCYARSTFIKGWGITFAITTVLSIVAMVLYFIFVLAIIGSSAL